MIRGTINEGISSLSKQRVVGGTITAYTGTKGESFEIVEFDNDPLAPVDIQVAEQRDIDARLLDQTTTPSNAFNGTFE